MQQFKIMILLYLQNVLAIVLRRKSRLQSVIYL